MRRIQRAALLAFLFAGTVFAQSDIPSLEKRVESIRGLSFRRPVRVEKVDAAGMREVIRREMAREYPEGEWPAMESVLKTFGFIPPKSNLKAILAGLMEDQVVGLYEPRGRTLYVSSAPVQGEGLLEALGPGVSMTNVYLVHEMAHALVDQHFPLLETGIEDHQNEDRASAARCVVEGDATWVMLTYLYGVLNIPADQKSAMDDLMGSMGLGRELMGSAAPAYIQENLLMGYLGGLALVKEAYARGGTAGIDALYRRPPVSMEQVLHPRKYFAGTDPPVQARFPEPETWRTGGWQRVGEGTWGELNVRIWLAERGVAEDRAEKAAEGWGGDFYRVMKGPDGSTGFVWRTCWDTEADAAEFAAACGPGGGLRASRSGRWVTVVRGGPRSEAVPEVRPAA